jgi:hypothetical protein
MKKLKIIYLFGAGRSGTTAIATFLGGHQKIKTLGEMHQFYDHLRDKKNCSCGESLLNCEFWSNIVLNLPEKIQDEPNEFQKLSDKLEYHSSIPKHFTNTVDKKVLLEYLKNQELIFNEIAKNCPAEYYLDSAKYIGRNLSLRKSKNLSIKSIYVVRDVRGVINSFSKSVQSSRKPLSTIFYYLSVNAVAEIVYLFSSKKNVIKIKYEDFTAYPEKTLLKLSEFLAMDFSELISKINKDESFEIGHIIGGNRLKNDKKITLKNDNQWVSSQSRISQIFYYFAALPFMLFNKYKI